MHRNVRVCTCVCVGVRENLFCKSVCRCMWVGLGVWDEFSEYLLETRFLTLVNYNMHPLQIFITKTEQGCIFIERLFLRKGIKTEIVQMSSDSWAPNKPFPQLQSED